MRIRGLHSQKFYYKITKSLHSLFMQICIMPKTITTIEKISDNLGVAHTPKRIFYDSLSRFVALGPYYVSAYKHNLLLI